MNRALLGRRRRTFRRQTTFTQTLRDPEEPLLSLHNLNLYRLEVRRLSDTQFSVQFFDNRHVRLSELPWAPDRSADRTCPPAS
jgi:hypothetical protein